MKTKEQQLLEEAYNVIKSTNSSDLSEKVRVYIVVRKDPV